MGSSSLNHGRVRAASIYLVRQALSIALMTLWASGCGSKSEQAQKSTEPFFKDQLSSVMDLKFDPDLDPSQKALIELDLIRFSRTQLQGIRDGSRVQQLFGSSTQDFLKTLNERVKVVIPISDDIGNKIKYDRKPEELPQLLNAQPHQVIASNYGIALWLNSLMSQVGPRQMSYQSGPLDVSIDSPRVGLIAIGQAYSHSHPYIDRITTWFHEGRHSDCTGGVHQKDLDRLQRGDSPNRKQCGHLHIRCPQGHPYQGAYACDDHAWGAYSFDVYFFEAISQNCTNCSEDTKRLAHSLSIEYRSRILVWKAIEEGQVKDPDLGSRAQVVSDIVED